MMRREKIDIIPVVDHHRRPIGLIDGEDVSEFSAENQQIRGNMHISKIIKGQRLACCYEDDDLDAALLIMRRKNIRYLLVTNNIGVLSGLLIMHADHFSKSDDRRASATLDSSQSHARFYESGPAVAM